MVSYTPSNTDWYMGEFTTYTNGLTISLLSEGAVCAKSTVSPRQAYRINQDLGLITMIDVEGYDGVVVFATNDKKSFIVVSRFFISSDECKLRMGIK